MFFEMALNPMELYQITLCLRSNFYINCFNDDIKHKTDFVY